MRPLLLLVTLTLVLGYSPEEDLLYGHFPEDFVWGAATAAYQVAQRTTNLYLKNNAHFCPKYMIMVASK